MKICWISWVAAQQVEGWDPKVPHEPISVESIGWLIRMDDRLVVIAQSMADDGDFADLLAVPRMCVLDLTTFEQLEHDGTIEIEDSPDESAGSQLS
jgi:hypothetical protein